MKLLTALLFLWFTDAVFAETLEMTTRAYAVTPHFFDLVEARYEGNSIEELLIDAGVPAPKGTEILLNAKSESLVVRGTLQTHDYIEALVIESRGEGVQIDDLPKWLIRSQLKLKDGSTIQFNEDQTISAKTLDVRRWAYRRDKGFLELRSGNGDLLFTAHLQPDGSTLVLRSVSKAVTEIALATE